jgi:hypothetical protein
MTSFIKACQLVQNILREVSFKYGKQAKNTAQLTQKINHKTLCCMIRSKGDSYIGETAVKLLAKTS